MSANLAFLQPLLGRTIEVYFDGLRTGVVKRVVKADLLTVQFRGDIGRHRVQITKVRGVLFRKRLYTVQEWLNRAAKKETAADVTEESA